MISIGCGRICCFSLIGSKKHLTEVCTFHFVQQIQQLLCANLLIADATNRAILDLVIETSQLYTLVYST